MPRCPACGFVSSGDARFCGSCGAAMPAPPPPPERYLQRGSGAEWRTLDDVIYTRDGRFGGIGALLVFFGAFVPWASTSMSFLGLQFGYGVNSPYAWLTALTGVAAAIFVFRPRSGSVVMVIGIVVAAWTVLFAITTLSNNTSPSLGVLLTLAGGGLLAYSGHLTNQYEEGATR